MLNRVDVDKAHAGAFRAVGAVEQHGDVNVVKVHVLIEAVGPDDVAFAVVRVRIHISAVAFVDAAHTPLVNTRRNGVEVGVDIHGVGRPVAGEHHGVVAVVRTIVVAAVTIDAIVVEGAVATLSHFAATSAVEGGLGQEVALVESHSGQRAAAVARSGAASGFDTIEVAAVVGTFNRLFDTDEQVATIVMVRCGEVNDHLRASAVEFTAVNHSGVGGTVVAAECGARNFHQIDIEGSRSPAAGGRRADVVLQAVDLRTSQRSQHVGGIDHLVSGVVIVPQAVDRDVAAGGGAVANGEFTTDHVAGSGPVDLHVLVVAGDVRIVLSPDIADGEELFVKDEVSLHVLVVNHGERIALERRLIALVAILMSHKGVADSGIRSSSAAHRDNDAVGAIGVGGDGSHKRLVEFVVTSNDDFSTFNAGNAVLLPNMAEEGAIAAYLHHQRLRQGGFAFVVYCAHLHSVARIHVVGQVFKLIGEVGRRVVGHRSAAHQHAVNVDVVLTEGTIIDVIPVQVGGFAFEDALV